MGRKHGNDPVDGLGGIECVQRTEYEVARLGSHKCGVNRFKIAHFTDEDHIRVLTKRAAQSFAERLGDDFYFTLTDERLLVAMQKFDGIFDRNDVLSAIRVDVVDDGRQTRGLSATGCSCDQHKSAPLLADLLKNLGQLQLVDGVDVCWNDAQ